MTDEFEVAVIGAGNVGIAVAYYLMKEQHFKRVALIDNRDPMSLTSAQSGENYRDWFPHPVINEFTAHSIRLMEELDERTVAKSLSERSPKVLGDYSLSHCGRITGNPSVIRLWNGCRQSAQEPVC